MSLIFGTDATEADSSLKKTLPKSKVIKEGDTGNTKYYFEDNEGNKVELTGTIALYKENGETAESFDDAAFITGDVNISGYEFTIDAQKFPHAYYICGETFARSQQTGKDEYLQFIVPKAKMLSEVTLTMEAEGDPAVFDMNLKVLRPDDGKMLKLVKYNLANG